MFDSLQVPYVSCVSYQSTYLGKSKTSFIDVVSSKSTPFSSICFNFGVKDNVFNGINNQRIFDEVKSDKKATGENVLLEKKKSFCGRAFVFGCNYTCFKIAG